MTDDLAEIRRGVNDLSTALALHDQKVESSVTMILGQQERMAVAVERISEATIAIKALAERLPANGRGGKNGWPDKRLAVVALGVLLIASVAAGGGAELMRAILGALKH